ncbi:MAG: methylthioribulose 1-phosphate dehydratase [Bacteriovoracaceae bacterium]|nr:methylthioribulose 1-phosphate dehydratase [Bacteriovoracaceae bacterium]
MLGKTKREHLVEAIRFFSSKGWTPATSSNFSFRETANNIVISRSGVDKSKFAVNDLIQIDNNGAVIKPQHEKSSAETLIHTCVYNTFPQVNCVLHTHSVNATAMSRLYKSRERIHFSNYEVLKAFDGIKTHETEISLPIFPNTQDMGEFCVWLNDYFKKEDYIHGLLIEGHGLYTWSSTIEGAKRQVEAFEFLLECEILESAMLERGK